MGSGKDYKPDGGFEHTNFEAKYVTENGIKIIEPKDSGKNAQTPMYSNTPNTMYAKTSSGEIDQVTIYGAGFDKRQKLKDIDIGHSHTNPDKKIHFGKMDIHVHIYNDKNRSFYARKPSKKERRLIMIARYGKRNHI